MYEPFNMKKNYTIQTPAFMQGRPSTTSITEDAKGVDYTQLTDAMAFTGVDLQEESEYLQKEALQSPGGGAFGMDTDRSKFQKFMNPRILQARVNSIVQKHNLNVHPDVYQCLALAAEERTRVLLEQMWKVKNHRTRSDHLHEPPLSANDKPLYKEIITQDVKAQLLTIENAEREEERKRKEILTKKNKPEKSEVAGEQEKQKQRLKEAPRSTQALKKQKKRATAKETIKKVTSEAQKSKISTNETALKAAVDSRGLGRGRGRIASISQSAKTVSSAISTSSPFEISTTLESNISSSPPPLHAVNQNTMITVMDALQVLENDPRFSPFQLVAGTLACLYILKNADRLVGLGSPEPLARLYSRNFYRATWILTALEAGFWTAMPIRPKFLKDIMSLVFSGYYLIFADQAEEKTRRIRATVTVEHIRASWERMLNPYLHAAISLTHPHLRIHQRKIYIQRPKENPYSKKQITAYIYYSGTEDSFQVADRIILDFPGGGFISMPPPCHKDYLSYLAEWTKMPIVSIDYGKAPEYPYPYALEECFDAYRSIMESNGETIGMLGWLNKDGSQRQQIQVTLVGDSAGGNLVASVMLKILEYPKPLAHPSGLVLIYPCLNFDLNCWMPQSHLSVIRAESTESIPGVLESKDHLHHKSPLSVVPDVKPKRRWRKNLSALKEDEKPIEERVQFIEGHKLESSEKKKRSQIIGTRLAMTSRMSFFNDRILTPDLMRAMALLYLGPNNYPDFTSDYYLSPIVAPDELLAQFPKIYLMCGEKDPLIDDTVIFAGRIREAKRRKRQLADGGKYGESFRMSGMSNANFDDIIEVKVLQGVSHAFLQMLALLPETKGAVRVLARWLKASFEEKPATRKSFNKINSNLQNESDVNNEDDEGVIFTSRRSTINDLAKASLQIQPQANGKAFPHSNSSDDYDHNNSIPQKSHLHISASFPNTTQLENGDGTSAHIHTSASGTLLTPVTPSHERERVLWEQKNILNEAEILRRRRENLVRGLRDGCDEQSSSMDDYSSSDPSAFSESGKPSVNSS
ncbi:9227_t:CDS:10 [Ambispora leptoticha]|uniref:Transcription initiation factor TFIID subunit 4 n=1 Tax=Ambispora leptoticha TaxID=144679 RepID=A0A9N9F5S1_9GLOM|nr:9227_t:CDS:10 [Ambispora leptoticha]